MSADDRLAFLARARAQSLAMGADQQLFKRCISTVVDLDRYDYSYLWTWLGVPIIQFPADIMATQEVVWATKPDVIIETGVARGGSLLFLASLLELTGKGTVIGIDIDIRSHNRDSIEKHPISKRIVLIEGSSTADDTIKTLKLHIPNGAKVMVILDSDHSRSHVLSELRALGPLVTPGCYLVVADTALGFLEDDQTPVRRTKVWHRGDEPLSALNDYLTETDRFEADPVINGKLALSSSPGGYLRCKG